MAQEPEPNLNTRMRNLETFEDLRNALWEYENILAPEYCPPGALFIFNVIYRINGALRTRHFENMTLEGFETEMRRYQKEIETYQEKGEKLFERVTELQIRPTERTFGRGKEFFQMVIDNEEIYYKCFTKTTNRCITTSAIKFMEPQLREQIATELHDHPLMRLVRRQVQSHQNIINTIAEYYGRPVVILESYESINKEDLETKIVLCLFDNHAGYITQMMPTVYTVPSTPPSDLIEDVLAIVSIDLEFEWVAEQREQGKVVLVSQEPNLVCMDILIRGKRMKVVKRSMTMALAFLVSLSNQGLVLVYSANGGKIEHQRVLKEIINNYHSSEKDYIVRNTNGSKIKTLTFGDNLKFYDTVLLLPMSVSDIAKNFQTTKEKGHADWVNHKPTLKVWKDDKWTLEFDKDQWYMNKKWDWKNQDDIDYCMNDCSIVLDGLLKYNQSLLGKVKCTTKKLSDGTLWVLANSSISSIGKQTLLRKYPGGLNDQTLKATFQEAYLGGRCENFYQGYVKASEEKFIVSIDVNSEYPFCATQDLPLVIEHMSEEIPSVNERQMWGMWAWVSYKEPYQIPPLGVYRSQTLYFPNLDKPALLFVWDFEYNGLKDNLVVHRIYKSFVFSRGNFSEVILPWYEVKKTATNPAAKIAAKMLLNGATGGLGLKQIQPLRVLSKDPEKTIRERQIRISEYYEAFDDWWWLIYEEFITAKTMFHTIAAITARGRWMLWNKIQDVLKIDPDCLTLRIDTDGVTFFCNKELRDHLESTANNELGGWDFEESEAAYIRGLKKYALDGKIVFNGINREVKDKLSMIHLIDEEVITDNIKWIQRRDLNWEMEVREVSMTCPYSKGEVLEDGKIKPWNFSNLPIIEPNSLVIEPW